MEARCSITEDDPGISGLISISHHGASSQATDGAFADETSEELVTDPAEDNSDDSVSDEDLKDLARHGLPSACIFVAKYVPGLNYSTQRVYQNLTLSSLAATQTDDQLMKSLQSHFGKFGRLHVKIRRDSKSNPYSFCQFEVNSISSHLFWCTF